MTISKYSQDLSIQDEEQRKIEEGADALLNLAGITTCSTNNNNSSTINHNGDIRSRKYVKTHSNSFEFQTNGFEEENYKPRFIRRNISNAKKTLKRRVDCSKNDSPKCQLSEKAEKTNKPKRIKLCKNPEKAKR